MGESSAMPSLFAMRESVKQMEEGSLLAPKFDVAGLIPVVTTDATSGEVLMMGVMNTEALTRTIESGEAHYWSRSRKRLWCKGATSGLIQSVIEIRVDDDQDAIWLRVNVRGGASCHVGYRSCFYRAVSRDVPIIEPVRLNSCETRKGLRSEGGYGDMPNPTQL
jgi:phosphoribosyl-AMP cyclohydrolase